MRSIRRLLSYTVFAAILVLSLPAGAEEDARPSTAKMMAGQTAMTAPVTTAMVGSSLYLFAYADSIGGPFAAILGKAAVSTGGLLMMLTSPLVSVQATNVSSRLFFDEQSHLRYPLLGAAAGGLAGGVGARAIDRHYLWRTPRLGWADRRGRTSLLVGLPVAVGMTLGAVTGYAFQRHRIEGRASVITPLLGTSHHAGEPGWIAGAAMQF